MSGPKVVRIVTREEVIALCEGDLARLDAALEEWIRIGRRNDCVTDKEIDAARNSRAEIAALLQSDRFPDLQKAAAREVEFLNADLEKRLKRVAEQAAIARASARRQGEAAKALLGALSSREKLSDDLRRRLENVISGTPDAGAMADGFAELAAVDETAGKARRREIANLHKTEDRAPSFDRWRQENEPTAEEKRLLLIDERLTSLEQTGDANAEQLMERRSSIDAEADGQRRIIKIDSLELDLAQTLAEAKSRAATRKRLLLALAELGSMAPAAHSTLSAKEKRAKTHQQLQDLFGEVALAIKAAKAEIGANTRREAVLNGLASLGYEVSEGMETAFVRDRELVLRSAARPAYGVEVGDPGTGRFQMRAIAFDDGPAAADQSRDRDAETIWCSEVASLQEMLAGTGSELSIERARPIGEAPLKRVSVPETQASRQSREGVAPKLRTLR